MNNLKILIAGASGFIGLPLVERLSAAGHEVMALSRKCIKTNSGKKNSVYWVQSDLYLPDTYRKEIKS